MLRNNNHFLDNYPLTFKLFAPLDNLGNKCRFRLIFVEAVGRFSDCYYPIRNLRGHKQMFLKVKRQQKSCSCNFFFFMKTEGLPKMMLVHDSWNSDCIVSCCKLIFPGMKV